MVKTSHAALYSIAGIIASQALSSVCGHAVDVTNLDYMGIGTAMVLGSFDWFKRHYGTAATTTA